MSDRTAPTGGRALGRILAHGHPGAPARRLFPAPAGALWRRRAGFIVGPFFDGAFFIFSPLIALLLGLMLPGTPLDREVGFMGLGESVAEIFIGTFIFAHLAIVFFRSHLNGRIFRRHPFRFTVVPVALLGLAGLVPQAFVVLAVAATFWDVYHSGMQTFGLGRIYDQRAGNDARAGRRLDAAFNLVLYAGPIVAGAALLDHVEDLTDLGAIGLVFFTHAPALAEGYARDLTWAMVGAGVPFLAFYVYSYRRLARRGYRVSPQKVALLASTGVCAIWAWGFNPFGQAFFIMNFFHALQYFALIWWSERGGIARALKIEGRRLAGAAALAAILLAGFGFGFWAETGASGTWARALVLVVALLHFWYDGFIWSVRRKEV